MSDNQKIEDGAQDEAVNSIKDEYPKLAPIGERLAGSIDNELRTLLQKEGITLGVPVERRVKTLDSILEKLERKSLSLNTLYDLTDFVGVRFITLFQEDADRLHHIIAEHFEVISKEDTNERLGSAQFGYSSTHFIVKLKDAWLGTPTYADLGNLTAEIQVRTLAQHIWAAASHKLQYKQEDSVPVPIRRAIHRASALLETVDLEFARVLDERRNYIAQATHSTPPESHDLNVDIIRILMGKYFPAENASSEDNLETIRNDLSNLGVKTHDELERILKDYAKSAKKHDLDVVKKIRGGSKQYKTRDDNRIDRGVFYTHTGLMRHALKLHFGEKVVMNVIRNRIKGGA